MRTEEMIIGGSAPPSPAGGSPAALSAMTTAMAPAFWAFLTLTTKVQVPRSSSTILPVVCALLVRAVHPSVVEGPAAFAASSPTTMLPVMPDAPIGGPNDAAPTAKGPRPAGEAIARFGSPGLSTGGTAALTGRPSHLTWRDLVARAWR